jgi:YegS/Rv2252/BmrU family lipid kinase
MVVISSDYVRHLLFEEPAYSGDEHYIVHSVCQELSRDLLQSGQSVVCDATNLQHRHRQAYYALAEESGARLVILQTVSSPETVRKRLQERKAGLRPAYSSQAAWELYQEYNQKMEPIRRPYRIVDMNPEDIPDIHEIVKQLEGDPAPLPTHLRARVILNPMAGQGHRVADLDETIGYLVRQGWEVSFRETHRPNEAMALARQAAEKNIDVVIVVGGDGTVNEVVNGLAGTSTALSVLPMGSGNVWAREQGLSLEPAEAARALARGQIRSVDLGLAGSRYFLLMASVGFDAAVVQALSGEGKPAFWPLGYIIKGLTLAMNFAGEETMIALDDQEVSGKTVLVVIGNTRLYGGVVQITHQASMDDGLLDICILRGKGGLSQISLFALAALLQVQERTSDVDYYRAREVTISSSTPLFVQTDGEPIGTTPMSFRAVPRALRVLVPKQVPPGLFSQP